MKKKKSNAGKVIKGAVVAGAVATAAYMLLGPDGKKNQAKLKKIAGSVKNKVMKDTKVLRGELMKEAKVMKGRAKKLVSKGAKKVAKW